MKGIKRWLHGEFNCIEGAMLGLIFSVAFWAAVIF